MAMQDYDKLRFARMECIENKNFYQRIKKRLCELKFLGAKNLMIQN